MHATVSVTGIGIQNMFINRSGSRQHERKKERN